MIKDKFISIDDFDLGGHHLLDWRHLDDIPHSNAVVGQVIGYTSEGVTWTTTTLVAAASVAWDNVTGKPDTYPPGAHTHPWDQVTGKPTFVNSVSSGTGINLSTTTGNVTITCDLTWSELADKPDLVLSADWNQVGFVTRDDSTLSWVNGTRTFTIATMGTT